MAGGAVLSVTFWEDAPAERAGGNESRSLKDKSSHIQNTGGAPIRGSEKSPMDFSPPGSEIAVRIPRFLPPVFRVFILSFMVAAQCFRPRASAESIRNVTVQNRPPCT